MRASIATAVLVVQLDRAELVVELAGDHREAGDAREHRHRRARHGRVGAEAEGAEGFVHWSSVHEIP